jgi:DNA-binding response OmpR family regulator
VRIVRTGFGFVRESEEIQPDMMILNDTFTDVGTLTILSNLRENPATGDIPILVITSGPGSEARRSAPILRGANFIDKPFAARTLVAELLRIHGGDRDFGRTSAPRAAASDAPPRSVSGVFLIGLDSDLSEWMETALRRKRITCYSASTFEQARDLAANVLPDVIFIDLDVSAANAAKFVQMFLEFPATRHTPIHLLGNNAATDLDVSKVQGILNKPFSAEEVNRIVRLAQTRRITPT